jgi:LCT (Lysosomal Cystine Transporter) family transporter
VCVFIVYNYLCIFVWLSFKSWWSGVLQSNDDCSIFTCTLRWNTTIRDQYNDVFSDNLVTTQDCLFALHGALLTAVTIFQCLIYDRKGQTLSNLSIGFVVLILVITISFALAVILGHGDAGPIVFHESGDGKSDVTLFSWLCWIYWLSLVKLAITVSKYIPQAVLNYQNKSTVGWSIINVLLDFTGGLLSVAQLLLDGATLGWSGVIGNPIKFALGFVSIIFDIIFMIQHYVLYTEREEKGSFTSLEEDMNGGFGETVKFRRRSSWFTEAFSRKGAPPHQNKGKASSGGQGKYMYATKEEEDSEESAYQPPDNYS